MEQQPEEWKQYKSSPYSVNANGIVRRVYNNGNVKYLKPCVTNKSYLWIDLIGKPERIKKLIHTMVAECFIPNPENKPMIDHINNVKNDNRVENLRWVTNTENQQNILFSCTWDVIDVCKRLRRGVERICPYF